MKGRKEQRQQVVRIEQVPPLDMAKVRANAWAELVRYLAQPETGELALPAPPWGEQQTIGTKEECIARLIENGSGINGIACLYGYADQVIAAALVQICRGARVVETRPDLKAVA